MAAGDFIKKPDRRFRLLVSIQVLWMATLLVLALWWGTLLKQQGDEIARLQTQLGVPEPDIQSRLDRTARMIEGESGTFIFLILIANGVLLFFFFRDTKRSRSLEAFFASITHELRTPLTSIRLQAEALRDIEDNPKHTPYLNRLLEDVSRLEGQVQQTLELARIEGGGNLNPKPLRIRSFLQNRILPQYELGDSRLKIECTVEESFVLADPSALTMVFRNLIDNALKYSVTAPARISIQGSSRDSTYELKVDHVNSNQGGSPKALGTLFERGTHSQGAGVGLYLVKTLMKRQNGSAEFRPSGEVFGTRLVFRCETGEHDG
ncbi:MAG: sensor histidine kinase [Proteobacteria bacterium]|nr:sensor histidine kinase [Pseudomonadota bacterium]